MGEIYSSKSPRWQHLLLGPTIATMTSADGGYGLIHNGAIAWSDSAITYVGSAEALTAAPAELAEHVHFAPGLLTPGLIDCHTHLVFAGNRADEFAQRLQGITYESIAASGGGIQSTVRQTRAASPDQLLAQSLPRALQLLHDGVTTLEIKSGYGLDLDVERKMLQTARQIGALTGQSVRTTYLGAHALPAEFKDRPDDYIAAVIEWMHVLHEEQLIDAVDAYCERIGFTTAQTRKVFVAAQELGLPFKLHADQLSNSDGALLATQFGALSADHLEFTSEHGVRAMANAGTVAVLLPGAFHVLREKQLPPIAALRDAHVPMAIATDCNPGTSPLLSLRLAMQMATTYFHMTPLECLRGTTVNAARALGYTDRGTLATGQRADMVLWNCDHPDELTYWMGGNKVEDIYVGGQSIHRRERAPLI